MKKKTKKPPQKKAIVLPPVKAPLQGAGADHVADLQVAATTRNADA